MSNGGKGGPSAGLSSAWTYSTAHIKLLRWLLYCCLTGTLYSVLRLGELLQNIYYRNALKIHCGKMSHRLDARKKYWFLSFDSFQPSLVFIPVVIFYCICTCLFVLHFPHSPISFSNISTKTSIHPRFNFGFSAHFLFCISHFLADIFSQSIIVSKMTYNEGR